MRDLGKCLPHRQGGWVRFLFVMVGLAMVFSAAFVPTPVMADDPPPVKPVNAPPPPPPPTTLQEIKVTATRIYPDMW